MMSRKERRRYAGSPVEAKAQERYWQHAKRMACLGLPLPPWPELARRQRDAYRIEVINEEAA